MAVLLCGIRIAVTTKKGLFTTYSLNLDGRQPIYLLKQQASEEGMTMRIGGTNGSAPQTGGYGMIQETDATTKSIQKQIADAQKQLQELSANDEISPEEKMKKRQDLQKKITDLNHQLRQHQLELRKEKQQERKNGMDEAMGSRKQEESMRAKEKGLAGRMSSSSMQALVSAGTSIKQAQAQGKVATAMKGQAGVLRGEIKQDQTRGVDVTKKQDQLSELEERIEETKASQISTLADANKDMKAAAQKDQEAAKDAREEKDATADKADPSSSADQSAGKAGAAKQPEKAVQETGTSASAESAQSAAEAALAGKDLAIAQKQQEEEAEAADRQMGRVHVDLYL